MKKKILDGQSLWDIALEGMGGIEEVFRLAEQEDLSLTEDLSPGQQIGIPQQAVNREIREYYAANQIHPATGISIESTSGDGSLWLEGVEFWGIEYDFIVS